MPRATTAEAAALTDLAVRNDNMNKSFRECIKNLFQANGGKIINTYTQTSSDGTQNTVVLCERPNGVRALTQIDGDTKNIPMCLRGIKRAADALDGDDNDEAAHEEAVYVSPEEQAGVRRASSRATTAASSRRTTAAAPKRRRSAPSAGGIASRRGAASASASATSRPGATGTRRSARVSSAAARNVFQNDPIPEHEEYQPRPAVKNEADDDLADLLNDFEIASNAGTDSTRIYSRETSRAMSPCTL